jgi:hypothetical protein
LSINLASFSSGIILNKLTCIHVQINYEYYKPFLKPRIFSLSQCDYRRQYNGIHLDGRIVGGLFRLISSLIDLSFIRSLVTRKRCRTGFSYGPFILFLLELFRYTEKYLKRKAFVGVLRGPFIGKPWPPIPSEGTFGNFRDRLGEPPVR